MRKYLDLSVAAACLLVLGVLAVSGQARAWLPPRQMHCGSYELRGLLKHPAAGRYELLIGEPDTPGKTNSRAYALRLFGLKSKSALEHVGAQVVVRAKLESPPKPGEEFFVKSKILRTPRADDLATDPARLVKPERCSKR